MNTPIVAAVDGSEESMRAVQWAAQEAYQHQTPLRIVAAPEIPRLIRHYGTPAVPRAAFEVASLALADAAVRAEELAPGLDIDTRLLPVGPEAVAVTDSGRYARMLVVGARGTGGFPAVLLGSVSRYAAMHATCPVVVVREESDAVHREIVVGVGEPDRAADALALAFDEAARRGATLVAAHAWHWPADGIGPVQAEAEDSEILAEMLETWRRKYPAVTVRQDMVRANPAQLLASYSIRADLVVIGRHGQPGGRVPVIGAVQHALLQHARGPVAIVPSGSVR